MIFKEEVSDDMASGQLDIMTTAIVIRSGEQDCDN